MPEYLAPGVYVEEIERGPRPIEGVATSTAAFLGETERGPLRPRLVTSLNEYARHFGAAAGEDKHLPGAVAGFLANGGQRAWICRITGAGATAASREASGLRIEAIGPGEWGNRLYVKLSKGAGSAFVLQVAYWQALPGGTPPDPFASSVRTPPPTLKEIFSDLVWDDPTSPDFYETRLHEASALIRAVPAGALAVAPVADFAPLAGGVDGAQPTAADYRDGLAALDRDVSRDVALVAAPAAADDVADALIEHCEQNRFRFAVLDCPRGSKKVGQLDPRARRATSFAACYHPWIKVPDPNGGADRLMPPSGHVLGVYARTDSERGVWKAPANETLRGVTGLEYALTQADQDILNPRGVNVIRSFPGRGIRVWGARTLSDNSLWKYVSVRRLFIFLERSIYEGTQWVVFEPNDEKLWARVKDTISAVLAHAMAERRAYGPHRRAGLFHQMRPLDDDPERHRQRPAGLRDRRRGGEAGRVRHFPHLPEHRRGEQLSEGQRFRRPSIRSSTRLGSASVEVSPSAA